MINDIYDSYHDSNDLIVYLTCVGINKNHDALIKLQKRDP